MPRTWDPGAIHLARKALAKVVARSLNDDLEALYKAHNQRGAYSPDHAAAGRRSLRNAALALMTRQGGKTQTARALDHYNGARNMTDRIAGLEILTHMRGPERKEALEDAYERWKGNHLTVDKWFAIQARSSLPGALSAVKKLTKHPQFSMQTPNKVYSLIGAFAMGNTQGFHRPDGKGYAFVGETVLKLDRFNPQIAARLLGSFRSWRALEKVRRAHAQSVLKEVSRSKTISRDVYEIVSKMLD